MTDSNHENGGHDGNNGLNINNLLEALLTASQGAEDADNLGNLDTISGEYTSLNNTMDELNKFMDRWEERHDRLRDNIREVLSEQEQENDGTIDGMDGTQTDLTNEQVEAQKVEVVVAADASHCQSQAEGNSSSKPNDVSKQVPQSESDQHPETSPS